MFETARGSVVLPDRPGPRTTPGIGQPKDVTGFSRPFPPNRGATTTAFPPIRSECKYISFCVDLKVWKWTRENVRICVLTLLTTPLYLFQSLSNAIAATTQTNESHTQRKRRPTHNGCPAATGTRVFLSHFFRAQSYESFTGTELH